MKQLRLLSKVLVMGLFLLLAFSAKAATYYVRPFGNTTAWEGVSGANIKTLATGNVISTFTSIDAAALATDTYYFAPGTYNINVTLKLLAGKIYGGFSGDETSTADLTVRATSDLDGNGIVEPWEFTNVVTFTTTATQGTYGGSGYANRMMTVTGGEVNGITFFDYNNSVGAGAIILGSETSGPSDAQNSIGNAGIMKNCIIRKFKTSPTAAAPTTAVSGIVMMTNSASVVDKCLIEDCRVMLGSGGAIYMNRMGGIVSNSVLRNNMASAYGGAIYLGNTAVASGYTGTVHTAFSAILSNCAIYNNTSGTNGGAVRGEATNGTTAKGIEVVNCTVVNNLSGATTTGSIELVSSGVIANSIVLNDTKFEIRPTGTTNYIVSTIYGENGGSTIYPGTNNSTVSDANLSTLNFTRATAFQGAVGNSTTDVAGFTSAKQNEIKAANYTISSSSIAVTTTSATLPTTFKNAGGTGSNNITIKSTVPSTDMLSVSRTGNFTLGAYQFGASVTWNGTSWSNGNIGPSSFNEATIDGTFSGAGFTAKKLTVNSGKSMTIASGNLNVVNEVVNNGTLSIANNANLLQTNNVANTGNVVVNRNSSLLKRLDYSLWSSPVASQNLVAFSDKTSTSPSSFYTYITLSSKYDNSFDPAATSFATAKGYLIRMPNTATTTPTAFAGQFTGVPNNGNISYTLSTEGNGFNLVGNPYPSPISMTQFVADNTSTITGTLYFWRKTNAGSGSAYCTWTGGTFVTNGNAQTVDPSSSIQTGQGFFVKANNAGAVLFNNNQRQLNNAGQFFKTKQAVQADKIWLNATNAAGDFSQMAVVYTTDATQGVDAFDGKSINDADLALTSNINNEEYTIQGRPSFDVTDVVALNFKTAAAGVYTIAIDHSEGVFATGQSVILTDATTGTETDLTKSSYTFTAIKGSANTRFSLKYQKTLGTDKAIFNENNVAVYKNKGTLYVNAGNQTIANIKVYDVQGRMISELNNVKAATAAIANLKATNQVLVVKITSEDNKVVTKKVLN